MRNSMAMGTATKVSVTLANLDPSRMSPPALALCMSGQPNQPNAAYFAEAVDAADSSAREEPDSVAPAGEHHRRQAGERDDAAARHRRVRGKRRLREPDNCRLPHTR